jgi:cytochrome P450 family 2 subfamily J
MFIAGTETSSSTLAFAILFMIREPHVQEKVRQEIHNTIGKEKQPQLTDKLPYTKATIMEIQRMGNIGTCLFNKLALLIH